MRELHVVPAGDLIDHDTFGDCVCGPATIPNLDERTASVISWTIRHHPLRRQGEAHE